MKGVNLEDYPKDLAEALKRANCYWYLDWTTDDLHIRSRNEKEPLTENEKKRISFFVDSCDEIPLKIIFDN